MPASGIVGSGSNAPETAAPPGGGNPFWAASNWYAEKISPVNAAQLGATQTTFSNLNINAGQFLKGLRLQMRSAGGVGGTVTADAPWNAWASLEVDNVDGSNIMYPMAGWSYYAGQRMFRPWLGDPANRYDYAAGPNPSGTLFLQPEIRHTAGVLSNTDSRSQYKYGMSYNTATQVITGGTTAPTITTTAYMDAWAQPDAQDLTGVPNQPLPPGLNLQTQRRHEVQQLLSAGATNSLISHLTGNEIRGILLVVRDSNNARQDYVSDPIRWTLDNRNLGAISPDQLFQWYEDFYKIYGHTARPVGVFPFIRFFKPGEMVGQGWLPTNNATKLQWEFGTPSTATNVPGTVEIITDEVIPVGPIPAELDMI